MPFVKVTLGQSNPDREDRLGWNPVTLDPSRRSVMTLFVNGMESGSWCRD